LGNSWPINYETQQKHAAELLQLLAKNISKNVWNVRVDILHALQQFLKNVYMNAKNEPGTKPSILNADMVKELLPVLFDTLSDAKYSMIRQASLDVIEELIVRTEGKDLIFIFV
jgi:hypothetical protein